MDKPLIGSPISDDADTFFKSMNEETKNDDFGEFHNNSAQINTNNVLEALCGNLSQE